MFTDFLISFYQLTRHILFCEKIDVVLYYPQHFNRSSEGTNPYFDPIIKLCRDNGLRYILLEEPDYGTSQPRNSQCLKADFLFWAITVLRKLMSPFGFTQTQKDKNIARLLDVLTFHKFRALTYITISNSMIDILGALNPKGRVFDYQHGIIFSNHSGYFQEPGVLQPSYLNSNRGVFLWGPLFKKSFMDAIPESEQKKRIKIVGYPIKTTTVHTNQTEKNTIVISLQMTMDWPNLLQSERDMLCETLDVLSKTKYRVLLKHHPRFNNCIDLGDILERFPSVEITDKTLPELVEKAFFHITWNSTTSLEYANYGIPTFFLSDERWDVGERIFYDQFKYPLYHNMDLSEVLLRVTIRKRYEEDCHVAKAWYDNAYAPFNEDVLLKILRGDE